MARKYGKENLLESPRNDPGWVSTGQDHDESQNSEGCTLHFGIRQQLEEGDISIMNSIIGS